MRSIRIFAGLQALLCLGVSLAAISVAGGGRNALLVQAIAAVLAVGLAVAVMRLWPKARWRLWALLAACLAAAVWTLITGVSLEGARRWLTLGPIQLHAASLILPIAAWAFARIPGWPRTDLLAIALALVLALQQDAASALAWALVLGVVVWTSRRSQPLAWGVVAVAAILAVLAWSTPDRLPAVPYVEGLLSTTFAVSPLLGILAGALMFSLPAPFLLIAATRAERRAEAGGLAALWTGWIVANLLGNYPAPVMGYGAAPLLAWGLSIGLALRAEAKQQGDSAP